MEPNLYIIARHALAEGVEEFLTREGTKWRRSDKASAAELIAEFAGRICYMSFGPKQSPRTNADYLTNLISQEHESVLEHVTWTFLLTGVSRAFTHQLVRHRPGFAYSQLSQQYHDESGAQFIEPHLLRNYPKAFEAWSAAMRAAGAAYARILSELEGERFGLIPDGNKKEIARAVKSAARSVLPNATETKIVVSANVRALRHFLRVRGALTGDEEMRAVSALIYEMLKTEAPAFVADFECRQLADSSKLVIQLGAR
jgi:thymidylate synthase (FAD)